MSCVMAVKRIVVDRSYLIEAALAKIDKPMRLRIIDLVDTLRTGDQRSKGKGLTADKSGTWGYRLGS